MSRHKNTVTLAYPAKYVVYSESQQPQKILDLHCTAAFLGDIEENELPRMEEMVEVLDELETNFIQTVSVQELAWFDVRENIPVLKLNDPDNRLKDLRYGVECLLSEIGVNLDSEFTYTPHITIDAHALHFNAIPKHVLLYPMELWYGPIRTVVGTARFAGHRVLRNSPY